MSDLWLAWFISEPCYIEAHAFCDGKRPSPAKLPCKCFCHRSPTTPPVVPGRFRRKYYKDVRWRNEYGIDAGIKRTPASEHDAEVVSSEVGSGLHCPALDVDVPAYLVPSSTPGHSHLYIDLPMSWRQYKRLLKALGSAGVLEKSYVKASLGRRHTSVRVPWKKKGDV